MYMPLLPAQNSQMCLHADENLENRGVVHPHKEEEPEPGLASVSVLIHILSFYLFIIVVNLVPTKFYPFGSYLSVVLLRNVSCFCLSDS